VSCFEVPVERLLGRSDESCKNDKSRWPLSVSRLQPENCYLVCMQYAAAGHRTVPITMICGSHCHEYQDYYLLQSDA
jgi:hypothetical protein